MVRIREITTIRNKQQPRTRRRRPQRQRPIVTMPRNYGRKPRNNRGRNNQASKLSNAIAFTPAGEAFLRDAFAPPDFQTLMVDGVPDKFVGRTVVKQHLYSGTVTTVEGSDTLILVTPTPGAAFWFTNELGQGDDGANAVFDARVFSDTITTFPPTNEDANFVKFRFLSLAAEVVPTANPLTVSGTLAVGQTPLDMILVNESTNPFDHQYRVVGQEGFGTMLNRSPWTHPVSDGCYSIATHSQPDWEFKNVHQKIIDVPFEETGTGNLRGTSVVGFGDHETIMIRYVPDTRTSPAIGLHVAVWATVEYQVQSNSILVDMARASPGLDELAMENYRKMAQMKPPAVIAKRNAGFWDTMLGLAHTVGSFLGNILPGPAGLIAGGVGAAAGLLRGRG